MPRVLDGHLVVRHYSGRGMWAFNLVVHKDYRHRLKGFEFSSRSCRIDLEDAGPDRVIVGRSILVSHLSHEHISESLAEVIPLAKHKLGGNRLTWVGDMNADALIPNSHNWIECQRYLELFGSPRASSQVPLGPPGFSVHEDSRRGSEGSALDNRSCSGVCCRRRSQPCG